MPNITWRGLQSFDRAEQVKFFGELCETVCEITVGKRAGTPVTRQAVLGEFPVNAVMKFIRYGFQRTFNDAIGGSDTDINEKVIELDDMLAAYRAGEVGRQPRESVDALQVEMRNIARNWMHELDRAGDADGLKLKKAYKAADADGRNDLLDSVIIEPNRAKIEPLAKEELARKAEKKSDLQKIKFTIKL